MAATDTIPTEPTPFVSVKGVSKTFGGIQALDDISLDLYAKDVVGLVGDNGAGKSTLIKILSGALEATLGEIELDGRAVVLAPPAEAQRLGVETVYQDLSLISGFTAAENVFLGREMSLGRGPYVFRWMRRRAMTDAAAEGLKDLHIEIPGLRARSVERMSGGQRQVVAIARAAFWGGKLLLLDEPTAALGVRESREVLELIKRLSARGLTIVIVTHNLEHLWQVCNRVVVMRRGRKVADFRSSETTMEEVVGYITGAKEPSPARALAQADVAQ
jgi:ABC-type sugar transport system ATPase subunit